MSRHSGRSMARGTTVTFLRTGARPGVLGLLLAGLLLAAACGHKTSAAQTLRTCIDRTSSTLIRAATRAQSVWPVWRVGATLPDREHRTSRPE